MYIWLKKVAEVRNLLKQKPLVCIYDRIRKILWTKVRWNGSPLYKKLKYHKRKNHNGTWTDQNMINEQLYSREGIKSDPKRQKYLEGSERMKTRKHLKWKGSKTDERLLWGRSLVIIYSASRFPTRTDSLNDKLNILFLSCFRWLENSMSSRC